MSDRSIGENEQPRRDLAREAAESRAKSIDHLESAKASVRSTLAKTRAMLEEGLGDHAVNEQRIVNGEQELAVIEAEVEALRVGDRKAMKDAAGTLPPFGHEQNPDL